MSDLHTNPPEPLDEELARLTDALLTDQEAGMSLPEAEPLMRLARELDALIAPRTAPSADVQMRLRQPVEAAWAERAVRTAAPKVVRRTWWVLAAAAAAIVVVALAIPPEAVVSLPLSGSAMPGGAGSTDVPLRTAELVVGFTLLAGWALWLRRPLR